jgi:hypothetical protein
MPMLRRPYLSPKKGRCTAVETVWQRLGNHHLSTASNVIDSIGLPSHHLNTLMGLKCCQPISHIAVFLPSSDAGVFASPLNASGIVLAAPSQHHVSPASLAASWPIADQSSLSPPWASKVRKRPEREDHVLYSSHTIWASQEDFTGWAKSEQFRATHQHAGERKPLTLGHPEFEGFEVIQTIETTHPA